MKRIVWTTLTLAAALLSAGSAAAQTQPAKIGYINSQRIMAEAPGTSEAQQAFEADMATYRVELERLETEINTLQETLDRQQATLAADALQARQQEIQQKFMAYQQRRTELEETAQRRQGELVGPIMEKISAMIEQIRIDGSYAMIFDAAAGSLITADPAYDLTEQVLTRLRAETPANGQ